MKLLNDISKLVKTINLNQNTDCKFCALEYYFDNANTPVTYTYRNDKTHLSNFIYLVS